MPRYVDSGVKITTRVFSGGGAACCATTGRPGRPRQLRKRMAAKTRKTHGSIPPPTRRGHLKAWFEVLCPIVEARATGAARHGRPPAAWPRSTIGSENAASAGLPALHGGAAGIRSRGAFSSGCTRRIGNLERDPGEFDIEPDKADGRCDGLRIQRTHEHALFLRNPTPQMPPLEGFPPKGFLTTQATILQPRALCSKHYIFMTNPNPP
jgi:hypothetical protein